MDDSSDRKVCARGCRIILCDVLQGGIIASSSVWRPSSITSLVGCAAVGGAPVSRHCGVGGDVQRREDRLTALEEDPEMQRLQHRLIEYGAVRCVPNDNDRLVESNIDIVYTFGFNSTNLIQLIFAPMENSARLLLMFHLNRNVQPPWGILLVKVRLCLSSSNVSSCHAVTHLKNERAPPDDAKS